MENLSLIFSESAANRTHLTKEHEELSRQFYLNTINGEGNFEEKLDITKKAFCDGIAEGLGLTKLDGDYTLQYTIGNSNIQEIQVTEMISVGRHSKNSLSNPNSEIISRIQCFIFFYKEKMVLIDMASLVGTIFVNLTTGEREVSEPKKRKAVMFGLTDTVELQIGNHRFMLNAISCGICCDRPRTVKFQCGHSYTCGECASKLQNCPVCRAVVTDFENGLFLVTNNS